MVQNKKGENAMKRSIKYGWFVVILCVGLCIVGCASYYKVTDPQSGNIYYTQDIQGLSGGAVKLKDAKSNSTVTLQNSQVKEISSEEYKAGLAAPVAPVSKPTPTVAATPTAAPVPTPAAAPTAAPAQAPAVEPAPAAAAAPSAAPAAEPAAAPAPAPSEAPK
jgi:uncharacterized protein YceK